MAPNPLPSPNLLRQLLDYDPDTGVLTWRARTPDMFRSGKRRTPTQKCTLWNVQRAGKIAGGVHAPTGYLVIRVDGRAFYLHRIAWAVHHGRAPKHSLDHIDGDKSNNRIANLRDVPHDQNCRNTKLHKDNKSGICGVRWDARRRRWQSDIRFQKRLIDLGRFKNLETAIAARRAAERVLKFHPNHGRS